MENGIFSITDDRVKNDLSVNRASAASNYRLRLCSGSHCLLIAIFLYKTTVREICTKISFILKKYYKI